MVGWLGFMAYQVLSVLGKSTSLGKEKLVWTAINRLSVIWKSDLTDEMQFFPSSNCVDTTTWMLTKHMEKKLDCNYTWMLQAILNKSWRQHPTKQQLYGRLPPITKTIQVRRTTRDVGHSWWSRNKFISDILLWTPSYGQAKARQPARTYIKKLCADTGYSLEDLLGAMNDREGCQERVRDIHAVGATSWWWWPL